MYLWRQIHNFRQLRQNRPFLTRNPSIQFRSNLTQGKITWPKNQTLELQYYIRGSQAYILANQNSDRTLPSTNQLPPFSSRFLDCTKVKLSSKWNGRCLKKITVYIRNTQLSFRTSFSRIGIRNNNKFVPRVQVPQCLCAYFTVFTSLFRTNSVPGWTLQAVQTIAA